MTPIPPGIRAEVRRRSSSQCEARFSEDCTGRADHLHHVVLRSQGGNNMADNLVSCCYACHAELHDHPLRARAAGLIRSAPPFDMEGAE